MKLYTVAVLGATGAVGQEMMNLLEERNFPIKELVPLASARSAGKTLKFKGIVARDKSLKATAFAFGRMVMTCCADDIQYCGLACELPNEMDLQTRDWISVTAKIQFQKHRIYKGKGPVLVAEKVIVCNPPDEQLATFY